MGYALVVALVVIWVLVGQVVRLALIRRGHHSASVVTAAVAGPVLALALPRAKAPAIATERVRSVVAGTTGAGPLRVVVGVDGSPEARAAVRSLLDIFGPQLGTVTFASVIGVSFPDPGTRQHAEHAAREALRELADEVAQWASARGQSLAPEQVVLTGEPAHELVEAAKRQQADLLVVGRRGAGMSKVLLGSVATRLASQAPVPVVIAGS